MQECLHCGGSGEEPFSNNKECGICLGEQVVPEGVNRTYYDKISEVLEDG